MHARLEPVVLDEEVDVAGGVGVGLDRRAADGHCHGQIADLSREELVPAALCPLGDQASRGVCLVGSRHDGSREDAQGVRAVSRVGQYLRLPASLAQADDASAVVFLLESADEIC